MRQQNIIVNGILVKDGRVMLAKRALTKKIAPGKYHLPGGHVEFGEDPDMAIKREFQEEFDLDPEVSTIIRTFSYTNDDLHTVGITFRLVLPIIPDEIKYDVNDNECLVWADERDMQKYLSPDDHDYITLSNFFKSWI